MAKKEGVSLFCCLIAVLTVLSSNIDAVWSGTAGPANVCFPKFTTDHGSLTFGSDFTINTTELSFAGFPATLQNGVAVWTFSSITIVSSATVTVTGKYPLKLLSKSKFDLQGTLDCSGSPGDFATGLGGPGGGAGGDFGQSGFGPGGGAVGAGEEYGFGSSGGSYGGTGARGGERIDPNTPTYGSDTTLQGGSGGGGRKIEGCCGLNGYGGGGGGACFLYAHTTFTFGSSSKVLANGGGGSGTNEQATGGGSGGGIILVMRDGVFTAGHEIQAKGGDGGTGGCCSDGGGGGGGRIAILAGSTVGTPNTNVSGGVSGAHGPFGSGDKSLDRKGASGSVTLGYCCGDGLINDKFGEQCERSLSPVCCTSNCKFQKGGTICAAEQPPCLKPQLCDGKGQCRPAELKKTCVKDGVKGLCKAPNKCVTNRF